MIYFRLLTNAAKFFRRVFKMLKVHLMLDGLKESE